MFFDDPLAASANLARARQVRRYGNRGEIHLWQRRYRQEPVRDPPTSARASVSSVVSTGLRMNGLEIFTDVSIVAYVCRGGAMGPCLKEQAKNRSGIQNIGCFPSQASQPSHGCRVRLRSPLPLELGVRSRCEAAVFRLEKHRRSLQIRPNRGDGHQQGQLCQCYSRFWHERPFQAHDSAFE